MSINFFDLSNAVILCPGEMSRRNQKAIDLLIDEVKKRTGLKMQLVKSMPSEGLPIIEIKKVDSNQLHSEQILPEGYSIQINRDQGCMPRVIITGNDERGLLFGIGGFLRKLHMTGGKIEVDADLNMVTAPRYPLRGHQLGYRPKTNSYDAWTPEFFEQYVRDLIVFGTNAIEILPPRTDDEDISPHMKVPKLEMMSFLSEMLDSYGLDVWIWYPAMASDYSDSRIVEKELGEWEEIFKNCRRVDAVFVPGGDPGDTPPHVLFPFLAKVSERLHKHHPSAQIWVSPQGFSAEWLDEFYNILCKESPEWLYGVVYGPWIRTTLPELRTKVPSKYPIRHYPDITHTISCQYPVPQWDYAYAATLGREPINPRPVDESKIFKASCKYTIGFITYSEGCNDDVNKIVWSSLGWNPDAKLIDILREYSRYFVSERFGNSLAHGIMALEENWRGPVIAKSSIYTTLMQFQAMEKEAGEELTKNWRFQQLLYRAYYDAYVRRRLIYETELEEEAMDRLREAEKTGAEAEKAISEAEAILNQAEEKKVGVDWRQRIEELAAELFKSCGMQLSVEKYGAIREERGATLDTVDRPVNNRQYLKNALEKLKTLGDKEKLEGIKKILHYANPGPGGFYDDLGNFMNESHLVRKSNYEDDPYYLKSPLDAFLITEGMPISWQRMAETRYGVPLELHYSDLDPDAPYSLKIIYYGRYKATVFLTANGGIPVHGPIDIGMAPKEIAVDIPEEATSSGELTLAWNLVSGRGIQVADVWLIKKKLCF